MAAKRVLVWVWILLSTSLVVGSAGAAIYYWRDKDAAEEQEPLQAPRLVEAEKRYYVLLAVLEVEAKPDPDGDSAWDTRAGAPDLYYEVLWQDQVVFESSTKDDTLVARWSNAAIRVSDLVDEVSLDGSIKAARITARPGDELEFRIYDADTIKDDFVGSWKTPVMSLQLGDQTLEKPGGRIVSVVCRVVPLDGLNLEALTR
ncbi:MAG: hypothetical protein V3T86_14895 [Planctomycetota bacterium]